MKRLWLILFLTVPLISQQVCQYDGSKLSNTHQGKIKNGKPVNLWKCLQGHEYWIVNTSSKVSTNPSSKSSSSSAFGNANNILKAQLERQKLYNQQELELLTQMTPEQREEYWERREEEKKRGKKTSCRIALVTLIICLSFWPDI